MQIVDSSSSIDQLFGMGIAYHYVLFRENCFELLSVDGSIFSSFLSFYLRDESSLCTSQFVWTWLVSCISSFLVIFASLLIYLYFFLSISLSADLSLPDFLSLHNCTYNFISHRLYLCLCALLNFSI